LSERVWTVYREEAAACQHDDQLKGEESERESEREREREREA
jgi:hypothetical protein